MIVLQLGGLLEGNVVLGGDDVGDVSDAAHVVVVVSNDSGVS